MWWRTRSVAFEGIAKSLPSSRLSRPASASECALANVAEKTCVGKVRVVMDAPGACA